MRFFVSYSRSLKIQVKAVVDLLRAAGHDVWWDTDIHTGNDWWAKILNQIEACQVMIFMISEKAVASPYCMEELRYASTRNRPILPFIMDDASGYTIPRDFGRRQWFVYKGDAAPMLTQIIADCAAIDWGRHADRPSPRPPEPGTGAGSLAKQYQQAVDLARAGQFEEAKRRFNNVASLDPKGWGEVGQRWITRLVRYEDIADLADHDSTEKIARRKWTALLQEDADLDDELHDPLLVRAKLSAAKPTVAPPVTTPAPPVTAPARKRPADVLPAPFAWIAIPGNKGKTWTGAPYQIAKYPVTHAQFAPFITAGGYRQRRWWTDAGWEVRGQNTWTEPRYWGDSKWNGAQQPVVGVSWYEALAYCTWLSDLTGESITLPTEAQWQYAAQGDDGRTFPWGNDWDCKRCNNSVKPCDSSVTTPVPLYQGKGDSFFGVTDMAGNVWEWCLTDYKTKSNDITMKSAYRVLRGGSWSNVNAVYCRCVNRGWGTPHFRYYLRGFRFVLS